MIPLSLLIGLILLGVLLGYDVYLAADKVPGNTWSEILRTWGKSTPFVAWVWSVLLGHWFHPGTHPLMGQPASVVLLVWASWVLVVTGMATMKMGYAIPSWSVILPGIVAGALLWPVGK